MGSCCDKAGNPVLEDVKEKPPAAVASTPPAVAETPVVTEPPKAEAAPEEPAKAEEPAAAAPAAVDSVVIEFEADGGTKSVSISEVPLGISFKNSMPLTAAKVADGSAAAKAGAQANWVFKTVGGKSLDGLDYNAALAVLKSALTVLPKAAGSETFVPGAFVVEFSTPEGPKQINFTKKPLGMSFSSKMPIIVTNITPGAEAEAQGVQVGWELTKMGEAEMTGKTYKAAFKVMQAGIAML